MAIRPIISIPDPRLRAQAQPVDQVDDRIRVLMDDLLETMMLGDQGIGLAANQIGVLERVIVINVGEPYHREPLFIANPEILSLHGEKMLTNEGCLSVPEQYVDVQRPSHVRVKYLDRYNKPQEIEATGLLSACLQHETDHLNGVLFVDHLSPVKKRMVVSKALRAGKRKVR